MTFQIYGSADAPEDSRRFLRQAEHENGFVPNILGILAGAPAALEGYAALAAAVEKTSFSAMERDVLLLTVARFYDGAYCLASQRRQADRDGLPEQAIAAAEEGRPLDQARLEALRQYALGVLENSGRPSDARIEAFLAAGYGPPQALDIVLIVAYGVLLNIAGRLAHPAVDGALLDKNLH